MDVDPLVTVEFRDGQRDIPRHLAVLMAGIETHTMTYEQAVRYANQAVVKNRLNAAQRNMVNSHFRRN
jgi:hypothetical protein